MKKVVLIESLLSFRLRYFVEADSLDEAHDYFNTHSADDNFVEASQEDMGEYIFSSRFVSQEEIETIVSEKSPWMLNKIDNFINKKDN
jgi:hypothetical protein